MPRDGYLSNVLPWETLRRLLGFPADMELPNAVSLVQMAVEQPRQARLIGMALVSHAPKEAPAGMILAALDRGALSREVGAELLGFARHRSGYTTVREMLHETDVGPETRVAGVAMARILGREAQADLTVALTAAPERDGREGAALGLCELGSPEDALSIVIAARDKKIRSRVAVRCATQLPLDVDLWFEILESDVAGDLRLGTELVYALLREDDAESGSALAALGDRAMSAVRIALADDGVYMLPDKREALTAWVS